jgi:hypothetical protein
MTDSDVKLWPSPSVSQHQSATKKMCKRVCVLTVLIECVFL